MLSEAHVKIKGEVIGVGFRAFIVSNASILQLKGYVRNVYTGTAGGYVEAVFHGEKKDIESMIDLVHQGPSFSTVEHVNVEWKKPEREYRDFKILR